MIKCLIALLLLPALSNATETKQLKEPRILKGKVLELREDVMASLQNYSTTFEALKLENFDKEVIEITGEIPMAVINDFNNDGIKDVVIYGIDKTKNKSAILSVISNDSGSYETKVLISDDLMANDTFENQQYVILANSELLREKNRSGFSLEFYDGSIGESNTYYYSIKRKVFVLLSSPHQRVD